jgi:hypothetical protein
MDGDVTVRKALQLAALTATMAGSLVGLPQPAKPR